jgi:hypothetical protein
VRYRRPAGRTEFVGVIGDLCCIQGLNAKIDFGKLESNGLDIKIERKFGQFLQVYGQLLRAYCRTSPWSTVARGSPITFRNKRYGLEQSKTTDPVRTPGSLGPRGELVLMSCRYNIEV